jgi:phosphoribosylformimino-5-aminoimidazole carboxamide ribotide isomerase
VRVIGVLDVLDGRVVRGVAGRRHEYRPVVSRLTSSCQPLDVARALRERLGLSGLYVADLDAIAGADPCWDVLDALHDDGFCLWVDAGVREPGRANELAGRGVESVVAGLETVAGPGVLEACARTLGRGLVFSLDLRDGAPLGAWAAWGSDDPEAIARRAASLGVRRVLVLDVARVGLGTGTSTDALCTRLAAAHPEVEVSTGGGVRGRADLERLRALGVRAALVASALHDGTLGRADLAGL